MNKQLSSLEIRAAIWGYDLNADPTAGTYTLNRDGQVVCTGDHQEIDDYLTRSLIANVTALPERTKQVIYEARHPLGYHG